MMKRCSVCWGIFEGEVCPFGKGEELPWAEDYALMGKGKMEIREHQRNVARWVLHAPSEHADSILDWAKKMMLRENIVENF
jgi:hypothetical protein